MSEPDQPDCFAAGYCPPGHEGNGSASELLTGAADAIERFGHQKHTMGHTGIGFCLHGAMDYVAWRVDAGQRFTTPVMRDAAARLARVVGTNATIGWNDDPARTKEEVVAALRQAAQWQPPQEQPEAT